MAYRSIFWAFAILLIALFSSGYALARTPLTVAVVLDAGVSQADELEARFVEEMQTLTASEFDLSIVEYQLDWNTDNFKPQLDAIYKDSRVDMLLLLGFAANQKAIKLTSFPKPTFLPFIVESELTGAPLRDGASGVDNLSYLTFSTQFVDSLVFLGKVVDYSNLAIIADELVVSSIPPQLQQQLISRMDGLQAQLIAHDGQDHALLDRIGPDVDAVMLGHLPRLPEDQLQLLIDGLIARKLAGFTYLGGDYVERGLLASSTNQSLFVYAARRNALNMQAVMLGEPASKQPVLVVSEPRLTINQDTAEQIGVAIDFKVLADADVIGFGRGVNAERYNLISLTAIALEENLDIKNESYNLAIQQNEQEIAKGRLRPQLAANASLLKRKDDSSAVQSGFLSEESTDVSISLSQTLFSDSEFANYKIQSLLYQASDEKYRQTQLDIIREASLAMADVLQAQAEAEIQRETVSFTQKNLELAIDRVKLGASSSADQYRWETEQANAKSAVFSAFSRALTAQQSLNRILNLKLTKQIKLEPLNVDELMIFSVAELFDLLDNARTFEHIYEFSIRESFQRSPEIKRIDALIAAKQRELKFLTRRRWMPDISLTGQLTENVDQTNIIAGGGGEQDWNIMLNARIPFYQGGQIVSQREKAELQLAQLDNQLAQTKLLLGQQLLASMNSLLTTLFTLDFSRTAAAAAERSLKLVTDGYTNGAVPIVDLFSAKNASVNADLAAVQAYIGFFRSSIEMQRVIGDYEFLMSEKQKDGIRQQFHSALQSK